MNAPTSSLLTAPALVSGQFVEANGLALHHASGGAAGAPVVIFLHALGCDLNLWARVAAGFTSTRRVITYDLRGHGLSGCGVMSECTLDDHARDLEGLLEKLDVAAAMLVGISVGGMIALEMARRFPARVRGLVLCATGARLGTRESWSERIAAVRDRGLETIADAILARWFAQDFAQREPATVLGYRNRLGRTPAAGYIATCAALRDADLRGTLGGVRVPALVLSAEHDIAAPAELGRELAAALPNARFELIPGAAHLPPVEQPEATAAAMGAFLQTLP